MAKWQILLSDFDIVYVTQKAVKGQALADKLAGNPICGECEPLKMYFPNKKVSFMGEDIAKAYDGWKMLFDGATNFKGVGIKVVLIEFEHVPRIQNELADALDTLSSRIQHPNKNYIDLIPIEIHKQPAYCAHVDEETNRNPWFHNIKEYLEKGEYPEGATHTQKHTLQRLANHFFHSGGILYRRIPDLGLLRCVNSKEASRLIEEIDAGTYGPHMNGFMPAKKLLRAGYFWRTMETGCIKYVQKCHQFQVHADMIQVLPNKLNMTSSPWPFASWGMDVIGPIDPVASSGYRFILVAIDYFSKWVKVVSYKAVTKKVIAYFVRDRIFCRFGVPESIITDNTTDLNTYLMKAMCETFNI
uniref:Uncharacterized protein LOC104213707 n=1 Tax=Nicotiana sylvestris TaxID=4096 RepID=A0A1U7UZW0_NICSY|nr:PREDICTED: uncharacterized protein LOC104213707 [Nicotiana sylvestris]